MKFRPLIILAGAMAILSVVCIVGLVVDPRVVTGLPLWSKPLKFSLSVVLYSVTLAWLLGMLTVKRRLILALEVIVSLALLIEMVIIVGAAVLGETSHFNVSTPIHTALWAVMAASISVVWAATGLVGILLFRARLGDAARTFAIRAAVVLGVVGMGLAFLMTGPQGDQISNYQGIVGAHTVGIADGGPGLPVLGWSTVAGDLRIPHFVGMHALQLIPLAAIGLELIARRVTVLGDAALRRRILVVTVILYSAVLAVLTAQALAGQSIVRPDAVVAGVSVTLFAAASAVIVLLIGRALSVTRVASPQPTRGTPA